MNTWKNWSGLQRSTPKNILKPDSTEALQRIIQQEPKIRVIGAGHSFSALAKTDDTLVSLDHLTGIESYSSEQYQSTIFAGTRLYELGDILAPINQALINQGDIDQQSLAGAISTGTHGTGSDLQCLSGLVEGFELLTANGELLWCDQAQYADIFRAGRVALGSFGILTKIKMQNRPRYKLKEHVRLCPIKEVFENISSWKDQHRHIEFWAFLHADQVILKTLDETDEDILPRKESFPSDDTILTICCELTRNIPVLNASLQKLLSVFVKPTIATDWSNCIFPTPRNTRFNEMEYQIPIDQGLSCLDEMLWTLRKNKAPMFFPFEFRYVKGDDIDISPFYQQDSVSISVHQYHKQNCFEVFNLVEPILQKYQGRPHWGKLHSMEMKALREIYPKWDDFIAIRAQLDPDKKWINPHLQTLFFENN